LCTAYPISYHEPCDYGNNTHWQLLFEIESSIKENLNKSDQRTIYSYTSNIRGFCITIPKTRHLSPVKTMLMTVPSPLIHGNIGIHNSPEGNLTVSFSRLLLGEPSLSCMQHSFLSQALFSGFTPSCGKLRIVTLCTLSRPEFLSLRTSTEAERLHVLSLF